jgi:ribosomal protein S12 methylthiotransferase
MNKKTFSIITLGCFRNTYDSYVISGKYRREGFTYRPGLFSSPFIDQRKTKKCQWLIINTCGFIQTAKKESLSVIEGAIDLKRKKAVEKIAVCGCLVKRYHKELKKSYPEVDLWQGVITNDDIDSGFSSLSKSPVSFLKIAEGCFNNCSYCAIPLIKGSLLSRPLAQIAQEARLLNSSGTQELNIIGQDITSWGKDLRPPASLTLLLKRILPETANIPWVRLLYAHPRHISDELLRLIASNERVCKYIDMPIQHASDKILNLMNRGFSRGQLKSLIDKIRNMIPGVVLRTSVIVGFPGETEADLQDLMCFLKDVKFQRLGVFSYSREEGTKAYNFPGQVHHKTKAKRAARVMALQKDISKSFNQSLVGKTLEVIIESKQSEGYWGRSRYDAPEVDGMVFIKRQGLKIGRIYKVKIVDALEYDLVAV